MMIDISRWLHDPELKRLFATLSEIGETRFIGGAVRDAILGIEHNDLDLATTALPEAMIEHARQAGFRIVPTGIDHGTISAILARGPVEITTLRHDVETDGRHATVAFTDDWQVDAGRRDFTINALSADGEGRVYDYFDGLADLEKSRVRFIGNPAQRIAEDYLRILRFFRFNARYGKGKPDETALAAIRELAPHIAQLSGERIQTEILKLLASPRAPELWQVMLDTGVVDAFLMQARTVPRLERLIALEAKAGLPDPFRRLMALLPLMLTAEVDLIAERLKLSGAQKKRMILAAVYAGRLALVEQGNHARALYGAEAQSVIDAALLSTASGNLGEKRLIAFLEFVKTWQEPKFPLGGDSLMALGMQPGPVFGDLLRKVEQWWIEKGFQPSRQECFAELKRIWKERKQVE